MIPRWLKYVAILSIMRYVSNDGVNWISKELPSYTSTNTVRSGHNSAPDSSGFWQHLLGTTSRSTVLLEKPNSRSATGTQEISRLLLKPAFHSRAQNSLRDVLLKKKKALSKASFLRIHFNIIYLQEIFKVTSNIQVFRPQICMHFLFLPCISHSQSFASLWRRGNCII
jgi:hypothetical protein